MMHTHQNNISVYVVEDDLIVAEELKGDLQKMGYSVLGNSDNYTEAVNDISTLKPDFILLDVNIVGPKSGIQIAETVQTVYKPIIIFLSAYSDRSTLQHAKEVQPHAYLMKPYDFNNLELTIDLAFTNREKIQIEHKKQNSEFAFLKIGRAYNKVLFKDILYVEADGSYTILHLKQKDLVLSLNLKNFLLRINCASLIRIHRKYVVNINLIESLDDSIVQLSNNINLSVSESYRHELLQKMNLA